MTHKHRSCQVTTRVRPWFFNQELEPRYSRGTTKLKPIMCSQHHFSVIPSATCTRLEIPSQPLHNNTLCNKPPSIDFSQHQSRTSQCETYQNLVGHLGCIPQACQHEPPAAATGSEENSPKILRYPPQSASRVANRFHHGLVPCARDELERAAVATLIHISSGQPCPPRSGTVVGKTSTGEPPAAKQS